MAVVLFSSRKSIVLITFLCWSTITRIHIVTSIQSPPLMIKQPPLDELLFQVAQRIDENDKPFIIECEAEGFPEPKYRWTKNGKEFNWQVYDDRISQQPGRGTLVVTIPETEDIGQYQCYAYNEFGVATSNSVFVRKSELNAFKDEHIQTVSTDEGKPFKLPCNSPDGWPKPHVYWMLQNQLGALKSINSSRITVDPEGTLWFSNVTRFDKSTEFNYACSAYSPFRNEYKLGNRVYLNVQPTSSSAVQNKFPPTLQYATKRSTSAIRGQTLELWCIVGGTPLPEIKWAKKGGHLPYDRLEYDNYGKTLRINNVDFSDEGSYDCDATNGVGIPISYSVNVQVNAAPYFKREPEIANAAEGETIEFVCEAGGKPSPEIKWIHNGKPLEEAEPNPRRKIEGNKVILSKIIKADTGNYGCNATNALGYVYKDVYVNVLALPPEITDPPKNVTTTDGRSVILTCRVFGAPKPIVRWIHNQQELTGGRFKVLENGDLMIPDVAFYDAGDYQCFAENKFGNDSSIGKLTVKVHTRIIDEGRPIDYEVAAGTSATFRCAAVADSTLTLQIDWYSDGELIDFDTEHRYIKLQDNSLTIDKTTELDSGVYTCVARTEYDNATASATLTVQDVPNRPELLDIDCGSKTARISWKPMGDNRSPILYYTIQYNTSFTPDSWETAFKDVPATETSYTVSMSPWANYTFRVIARNKIGPSLPSTHSPVCTTPEDVPFKNPENVKGDGTEPNNLRISWTPMPEIEHNGPKFKYQIKWKQEDDDGYDYQIQEISDWRVSEIIIPNQPTYRPYSISVRAVNARGDSNVAPTVIRGYSGQAEPTEAPGNFTLLDKIDSRTALVSWNAVLPQSLNGKFEGYKVETWTDSDGDDNTREIIVKNDVTTAVVDKLIPYSRNFLRVFAYNTAYNGPSSRIIEVVTGEGTPGPVESFEAFPLGASSIYLVWQRPERPNGILRGYLIKYKEVNGTQIKHETEMVRNITDERRLEAKLSSLRKSTTYRIGIVGYTSEGTGDEMFTEMRTYDGAAVQLVKPKFRWDHEISENGVAAIRVIWLPNIEGEGRPGDHFYVQYKKYGATMYTDTDAVSDEDFIIVRGLDPAETYVFRVVAVDGDKSLESDEQEIFTQSIDGPFIQAKEANQTSGWFIGLIVALAFLLLILILVCIVKRNRGGKYAVYEREIAHGRLEFDDGGFREYSQPSGRSSMLEPKPPQESDTDSMQDYADAKFTEDGSFIGQYGKKKASDLPSPMATFV